MPTFLYTAVDNRGVSVTKRLDAGSLAEARQRLQMQGNSKILFHTDEFSERFDQEAFSEVGSENPLPRDVLSAKQEVAARQRGGVAQEMLAAWKGNWPFWVPLFVWDSFTIAKGRPVATKGWIGFALTALFFVYFVWLILPGVAYQKVLEACVWFRWDEARGWIKFIRFLKKFALIPIPDLELDFRFAFGFAADGKLGEALAMVKKYENHKCGKYIYFGRLAGLYELAGDYPKMTESRRLAAQHGSGLPAERLDIAFGLLRREQNPSAAREVLAGFDEEACSGVVKYFFTYCQALVALEESEWATAESRLKNTIQLAAPFSKNILVHGMLMEISAYRAIALAHLGHSKEAETLLREAEPLLEARKEHLLLRRCHAALSSPVKG